MTVHPPKGREQSWPTSFSSHFGGKKKRRGGNSQKITRSNVKGWEEGKEEKGRLKDLPMLRSLNEGKNLKKKKKREKGEKKGEEGTPPSLLSRVHGSGEREEGRWGNGGGKRKEKTLLFLFIVGRKREEIRRKEGGGKGNGGRSKVLCFLPSDLRPGWRGGKGRKEGKNLEGREGKGRGKKKK